MTESPSNPALKEDVANTDAGISQRPEGGSEQSKPRLLSCVSCRKRKVKCDKFSPCGPCQRSFTECIFPTRARNVTRHRAQQTNRDSELLQRISRLESLVEKVGGEKVLKDSQAATDQVSDASVIGDLAKEEIRSGASTSVTTNDSVVGSRFLAGDFWVTISDNLDGLKQLLEQSTLDDDEEAEDGSTFSTGESNQSSPSSFPFGLAPAPSYHPPPEEAAVLVDLYFRNVDPVFKILHRPTVIRLLPRAAEFFPETNEAGPLPALLCSIYLAAVTSLSSKECLMTFGHERDVLLARYNDSIERALARADFLNSMELMTLQAFTIYLLCLRCHSKSRSGWTLISLAVRIAQSLGLHRDGEGLAFSVYEAEMRRRTWWQITLLDNRASEDRASDPIILHSSFNTAAPSNVNDEDFDTQTQRPLLERQECTEMVFVRLINDVSIMLRHLTYMPWSNMPNPAKPLMRIEQMESKIQEYSERLESMYLSRLDLTIPIHWVASKVGRIIIIKLWLYYWYPQSQQINHHNDFSREQSLKAAISVLEISEQLETNKAVSDFCWFLTTFVQWHPLAVALAELCHQTQGPLVARAWSVIGKIYQKWGDRIADTREGTLWRPIRILYKKAQAARHKDMQFVSATSQTLNQFGKSNLPSNYNMFAPVIDSISTVSPNTLANAELDLPDLSLEPTMPWNGALDMNQYSNADSFVEPMDWSVWNEFIVNAEEVGMSVQPDIFAGWPMPGQTF